MSLSSDYLEHYRERKRIEAAVKPYMQTAGKPKIIPAADANDVLREQLEFVIEHASGGSCGCSLCGQYAGVRAILMTPFLTNLFEEKATEKTFVMTAGGLRRP